MNDVRTALRELGQQLELEAPEIYEMDHSLRGRVRLRQARTAGVALLLAAVLTGGAWTGLRVTGAIGHAGDHRLGQAPAGTSSSDVVTPVPTAGTLAMISVNGFVWTYEVVQVEGVDRLRFSNEDGDMGYYDFPPADPIVAMSFSDQAQNQMGIGGIVPNASRVVVEMSDGRSIEAEVVPLPPSISEAYVLFVANVQAPLTSYAVVAIDAQGAEVARRQYKAPRLPR